MPGILKVQGVCQMFKSRFEGTPDILKVEGIILVIKTEMKGMANIY